MNKRIISVLLCFVMLISVLVSAAPVYAVGHSQLKVTADKATANPGDTVNFAVSIGAVNNLGILEFQLKIPAGLTIDENSVTLPTGIEQTLDSDGAIVKPWSGSNWFWRYSAQSTGYTGNSDLVLVTFACTVDANSALENKTITVEVESFYDNDIDPMTYDILPCILTVETAPVAVTGVTIDETLALNVGQSSTPTVTVAPAEATNKAVSFVSSDPAVASVNASTGEVTGVKKGTATITVTTVDGSFTDTCTVTVSCAHANKTPVAEQASDCKTKGWDAYMECSACGQLFDAQGVNEIDEIPFRALSNQHTGGSATCTQQAVCTVCGAGYGNLADHDYTAADKKAEALKTAGNCRDEAVYYYSCTACGAVERNDNHTFEGAKDASVHTGGTTLVNVVPVDHKAQQDGYTGDTECLSCGDTLDYGHSIPAGAHQPESGYHHDGSYHWKICTVANCGVTISGSMVEHGTVKAENKATCQKAAVCDDCGASYGMLASHDPEKDYSRDASGHWYACQTTGCQEKVSFAQHNPDHQGGATEEYPVKCTECGWIIEQQLAHNHVFDQEVANAQYLATEADCSNKATYYKSCKCGEKGSDTFAYGNYGDCKWQPATCTLPSTCSVCGDTTGDALGHAEGREWKKDQTGHWHICTNTGCGVVIDTSKAAHTPDRNEPTETDPVLCTVCGYEIAPVRTPAAPSTPAATAAPVAPAAPAAPKTGDSSMPAFWALLMLTGVGAAVVLYRKKNEIE